MSKNLFAYTEPHNDYPAFVSINKDDDGQHRITVRSQGDGGRNVGNIVVSPETLEHMALDVMAAISGEATAAKPAACRGANCGSTDGVNHSPECIVETAETQGWSDDPEAIEALYKVMVNRFLCWKLPKDFAPDCHIHFDREAADAFVGGWPVGTNLLTASQALEMFKQCIPQPVPPVEAKLTAIVKAFIEKQQISCADTIYQSDRVIENAYVLIEELCNAVGYHETPEDD